MFASYLGDILDANWVRIIIIILVAILVQMIVREVLARTVRGLVVQRKYASKEDEKKREDTLIAVFRTLAAVIIWILALLLIFSYLNVNIAALATGAGLIGVVVGFGAQNAVRDFLAGLFIIIERQYQVGDVVGLSISTGGTSVSGIVEDISIRVTRLRDMDGNLHTIPNGVASVVTNMTYQYANVNCNIDVNYDSDIDKIEEIINKIGAEMAKEDAWRDIFIEPIQFYRVDNWTNTCITVKALGKVTPINQWSAQADFRRRLIKEFRKHDIQIAFPQMAIHHADDTKTKQ